MFFERICLLLTEVLRRYFEFESKRSSVQNTSISKCFRLRTLRHLYFRLNIFEWS